jgi:hypothetical protein
VGLRWPSYDYTVEITTQHTINAFLNMHTINVQMPERCSLPFNTPPTPAELQDLHLHLPAIRMPDKLAYGDVGHPGFSATPIRSTTHFLNAIYQLKYIIVTTQYIYFIELKLLL